MPGFPAPEPGSLVNALDEMDLCGAMVVHHDLPDLMACLALVREKKLYVLVDDSKPCWCEHTVRMLCEDGERLRSAVRGDLEETG